MRAQGLSYRKIAAELESQQILTKAGEANWRHTTIKSILNRLAAYTLDELRERLRQAVEAAERALRITQQTLAEYLNEARRSRRRSR